MDHKYPHLWSRVRNIILFREDQGYLVWVIMLSTRQGPGCEQTFSEAPAHTFGSRGRNVTIHLDRQFSSEGVRKSQRWEVAPGQEAHQYVPIASGRGSPSSVVSVGAGSGNWRISDSTVGGHSIVIEDRKSVAKWNYLMSCFNNGRYFHLAMDNCFK